MTNTNFSTKKEKKVFGREDVRRVLLLSNSFTRWNDFVELLMKRNLTPDAAKFGFSFAYTCGHAPKLEALAVLKRLENYLPVLEDEHAKAFFSELPERVTLFRGTSVSERENGNFGISWTTNKQTAEFFAFRFQKKKHDAKDGVVLTTEISKHDVLAVFTDRSEDEILINTDTLNLNLN